MNFVVRFIPSIVLSMLITISAYASDKPILIIGASLANKSTPFNNGLNSPLGGTAVNNGSYLDLGAGLERKDKYVINEAQAGGTTQQRVSCGPSIGSCGTEHWNSYMTQLQRAIKRVPISDGTLNADYVLISTANDCLHPNDRGLPWDQTSPCTTADFNAFVDRLIEVGLYAIDKGLVPIYEDLPPWNDTGLNDFKNAWGFPWVNTEAGLNEMREIMEARFQNELPSDYIYLDIWRAEDFADIGDGLHPNTEAMEKAVERILEAIADYES